MIPIISEVDTSELGTCEICPSWKFSSNTEADRHKRLFHPYEKMYNVCTKRKFTCNFKVDGKNGCGEVFSTQHFLTQHNNTKGHTRNRTEKAKEDEECTSSKKKKVQQVFFVAKNVTRK